MAGQPPNRIRNQPAWLLSALNLEHGSVPRDLYQSTVVPMVDAYSDGWAVAVYKRFPDQPRILNAATPQIVLIPADPTVVRRLVTIHYNGNGFAAERTVQLTSDDPGGISGQFEWAQSIVPAAFDSTLFTDEILGGLWQYPYVPGGWELRATCTTLVAVEQINIRGMYAEAPLGFVLG